MKVFAAFCAVAILSACAANTVATRSPTPVQKSLWKTDNYRVPGENTGVLVINRDTGMRGAACIPLITIGEVQVAPINVGENLELHLTAGRHSLRAYPNRNCAASSTETSVEIKEGQATIYRFGFQKRSMAFTPVAY